MTQADETTPEPEVRWPPAGARQRIGEMLLDEGLIRPDDLEAALELQRRTGLRLGETVVTLGFVSSFDVARVLARRLEVDFVDLEVATVDREVVAAVPEEVARRYRALPIRRTEAGAVVVMCDPRDVFAIDDLRVLLGSPVIPALADPGQIEAAIGRAWARTAPRPVVARERVPAGLLEPDGEPGTGWTGGEQIDRLFGAIATSTGPADERRRSHSVVAPIPAPSDTLVHSVLAQAIEQRATDVHFEPGPAGVRVRFRVDGALRDVEGTVPAGHGSAMRVIKILAGVDASELGRAQRGRFSVAHDGRTVDVTLSTLPAADGEVAVLGIQDDDPDRCDGDVAGSPPALDVLWPAALGLGSGPRAALDAALHAPQGLVLVGGPSGSGRRTTARALLADLDRPDRSLVALGTEPDRGRDGTGAVKHIRIDARAGLTAAAALQSAVRADADVVLVGPVEDPATARAAVDAARSGRVVIGTSDTSRAASIPLRLVDLGVEPFLVTASLTCAVAQRLARRLCTHCSEPDDPGAPERGHLGLPDELLETGAVRRAVGCEQCGGTGYRGRVAIAEVLPVSETVARLVTAGASGRDIERWAVADGMDTLRMAAFQQVAAGTLDLAELARVVG